MNGFTVNDDGSSAWIPPKQAEPKAKGAPKAKAAPQKGAPSKAADSSSAPVDTAALEKKILGHVNDHGSIEDTADFMGQHKLSAEELDPVLKSLVALEYLVLEVIERKQIVLTEEGESYAVNGSPEF